MNEAITDHEILPTAYNTYRRDRIGRTGGGVMITEIMMQIGQRRVSKADISKVKPS